MTDKVQKIRKEVERLKSNLIYGACSSQIAMETMCKEEAYNEILAILDSLQEESNTKEYLCIKDFYPYKKGKVYKSIDGGFPANAEEYFKLVEEPTTSVWHDASEKAINNAPILFHSTYDNRWYALSHNRINWNVVDKWAYIDDLLKL